MTKDTLLGLVDYLQEGGDMMENDKETQKWFHDCSEWVKAQADKLK